LGTIRAGGRENRRKHSGSLGAGGRPFLFFLIEACTCSTLGRSHRNWLRDVKWFDAYELYSFVSPQKQAQGLFFLNSGKKYREARNKQRGQGQTDAKRFAFTMI